MLYSRGDVFGLVKGVLSFLMVVVLPPVLMAVT